MRRGRGNKRASLVQVVIFVLALVVAIVAAKFLPVPGEWKKLVFFTMIPLVALAGTAICKKMMNR